jgi:small conductance mechanosensitive channel
VPARPLVRLPGAGLILLASLLVPFAGDLNAHAQGLDTLPELAPQAVEPPGAVDLGALDALERLLAVYRRIPGLSDVRLHLDGGILELRGTALTPEDRDRAIGYARELLPGVVFVDARGLLVEADFRRRLHPAVDRIREKGVAFLRFLPTLLLGLLLVGAGALAAAWLGNRDFLFRAFSRNPFARNLARQVVRGVVFLVVLLLALDLMAVTALVGALLGAAGVAGIALGFAFRDIVENYLAGVLLSVRQPFAPNDHVLLAGEEGRVVRLTGRETVLMTLDGNHVRIPNATVFKAVITNLTRNPRRRFTFEVGVAPDEELGRVIASARAAVTALPGVLETPAPSIRVLELRDSSVALRVSGWVDQRDTDFSKLRSQAIRGVKEAFEADGIRTPPPEFQLRMLEPAVGTPRPAPTASGQAGSGEAGSGRAGAGEAGLEDLAPDRAIEEEIARELQESDEENLLTPPSGAPSGTSSGASAVTRTGPPRSREG